MFAISYQSGHTSISGKSYKLFCKASDSSNDHLTNNNINVLCPKSVDFYRIQWLLEQPKDDGKDKITFCDFYMHVYIIGNMKY